mmetsp:Transcript_33737/g.89712  ORF Transcript_33737/g.89712 Transcript_33737/m.89712 type:complete len:354 (-) Transcript_33737:1838-2899(-)
MPNTRHNERRACFAGTTGDMSARCREVSPRNAARLPEAPPLTGVRRGAFSGVANDPPNPRCPARGAAAPSPMLPATSVGCGRSRLASGVLLSPRSELTARSRSTSNLMTTSFKGLANSSITAYKSDLSPSSSNLILPSVAFARLRNNSALMESLSSSLTLAGLRCSSFAISTSPSLALTGLILSFFTAPVCNLALPAAGLPNDSSFTTSTSSLKSAFTGLPMSSSFTSTTSGLAPRFIGLIFSSFASNLEPPFVGLANFSSFASNFATNFALYFSFSKRAMLSERRDADTATFAWASVLNCAPVGLTKTRALRFPFTTCSTRQPDGNTSGASRCFLACPAVWPSSPLLADVSA